MKDRYSEHELPDTYKVWASLLYVCDEKVVSSHIQGTVADLKKEGNYTSVKNCNIYERKKAETK